MPIYIYIYICLSSHSYIYSYSYISISLFFSTDLGIPNLEVKSLAESKPRNSRRAARVSIIVCYVVV